VDKDKGDLTLEEMSQILETLVANKKELDELKSVLSRIQLGETVNVLKFIGFNIHIKAPFRW